MPEYIHYVTSFMQNGWIVDSIYRKFLVSMVFVENHAKLEGKFQSMKSKGTGNNLKKHWEFIRRCRKPLNIS